MDIPDSTDWLESALPSFTPLENALRCQVCKDFFDTPMMTSCSHTFCSLCIRRCFAADGKCPTCRASDQDSKLRRNWAVQELVDTFQAARPAALELAKKGKGEEDGAQARDKKGVKRKLEIEDSEDSEDSEDAMTGRPARKTRSQARRPASRPDAADVVDLDGDASDGEDEARRDDGLVACPMCNRRMKEEAVFSHLDRCDGQNGESNARSSRSRTTANSRLTLNPLKRPSQTSNAGNTQVARLPQLNYSLLKDNALRKKLLELGIPPFGPRPLLIRRHTEWVNLWNANCDSIRPRTKRELLSELDSWERSQGGGVRDGGGSGGGASVLKKDFDGQGWAESNKSHFDELIASAKKKVGRSASEKKAYEDGTEEEMPAQVNGAKADSGSAEDPSSSSAAAAAANPYEVHGGALDKVRAKVEQVNNGNLAPSPPPAN